MKARLENSIYLCKKLQTPKTKEMEGQGAPLIHKRLAGKIMRCERKQHVFEFISEEVKLVVSILNSWIYRFRYITIGSEEPEFSYAIDPAFLPSTCTIDFKETQVEYRLILEDLVICVSKENMLIRIENKDESVLIEDEIGFHWEDYPDFGGNLVYCSKKIQKDESFFGMGDKPTELDLKGKRISNWNSDTYGYEAHQDPVYRSIPFYYGLHHGMAYGLYLDNTFKTNFDFGKENDKVLSFWADGGELNYYFIAGPELLDVARRFAQLTGRAPMPPLWALGFHQCKWSYYPESKVKEIAQEFRKRQIPCDSIYLDIDYMDGFRCFTWNPDYFPNPKKLLQELKKQGFKTVVIIDPGIKIDPEYSVYQEGMQGDYFCKRADGPYMKGAVWPGDCHFPDYTNPKVRTWWGTLFKGLIDAGVEGIWNDMNEPAVFGIGTFPNDVRHDFDGHSCSHRKAHNVYGMQMARASFEGVQKLQKNKRAFNITRSGFTGLQRYSSLWTGDNIASWNHLWLANLQVQRLNISGVSFCGSDIGGFTGEPDPELFARWIQLGLFHPFMRAHSSGDKGDKEPWVFGVEVEKIAQKYISLRYQLLPYIYTTFWQHHQAGTPMVRPLTFIDQKDPETYFRKEEFQFGDHLFACPVSKKGATTRKFYLPKGKWYQYWTDEYVRGAKEMSMDCPLDMCPMFVRAGAVLPNYPIQQFVGEKKIESLILHVYYTDYSYDSEVYEDDGEKLDYQQGVFLHRLFSTEGDVESFRIVQSQHGLYDPQYARMDIIVHGLPFKNKKIKADQEKIAFKIEDQKVLFQVNPNFKAIEITA